MRLYHALSIHSRRLCQQSAMLQVYVSGLCVVVSM